MLWFLKTLHLRFPFAISLAEKFFGNGYHLEMTKKPQSTNTMREWPKEWRKIKLKSRKPLTENKDQNHVMKYDQN